MVQTADGTCSISLGQRNAQFLCGSATEACARLTGATATAGENLSCFRVSRTASLIKIIAVMLSDELAGLGIQLDQEVTRRVKLDESL